MRKILIFIITNFIGLFIAYVLAPSCGQCRGDDYCPPCIGKEEGIFLIALLLFDIFYIYKYFIKPRLESKSK
ncbi:hypothetical protein [Aquimarina sp. Aq78]|uniref:hypothetical protein n=1 Tax=Aquimarina sp. Aq78 TaxID=1191889 RepID=UPI000D0FF0A6|nr:hypothetical protein [Aquimarina sp. Aq78]